MQVERKSSLGAGSELISIPKLSSLFYKNMHLHKAVEASPFVEELKNFPTKEAYVAYLNRLKIGFEIIEPALKGLGIKLEPFFRLTALNQDIKEMGTIDIQKMNDHIGEHKPHLEYLRDYKPHALIAHVALRYYALLHGGQTRSERLSQHWGTAITLYSFENDAKTMLNRLNTALNEYGEKLTFQQFKDVEEEVITAWVFAGDVVLKDVRNLL
ncbi:MAG: biliverdin-producing heme oxygenase [Parachlamydiaceae bacterium]|nr:biliverdin-producing heme oxygenase [Parachlamydiaceae bacterium]